ncbi:DedA family protein [Paenibacillus algorifonticola]|uniref:DedA family protein n=1 Tax=Paenibacillus algorifonticola TaxID=684063 RepID=UPI003D2943F6
MSYDTLLDMIQQYGYAALFFSLWLGIVGMPIPDEVIVMTGGAVTANGILHTFPAFLLTYLGVISGLSLGFVLGRFVGSPILDKLRRKKNFERYINFSERLMLKYGSFAIFISYALPVVRHVMPYLAGINKMSFRRYAFFSYTAGLIWTLIFFVLGRFALERVHVVGNIIYTYGIRLLWIALALAAAVVLIRLFRRNKKAI